MGRYTYDVAVEMKEPEIVMFKGLQTLKGIRVRVRRVRVEVRIF